MQKQLQLLRNRRKAGLNRPINGSAELDLEMAEYHPQKDRLVEIIDDIENSELGIIEVTKISD